MNKTKRKAIAVSLRTELGDVCAEIPDNFSFLNPKFSKEQHFKIGYASAFHVTIVNLESVNKYLWDNDSKRYVQFTTQNILNFLNEQINKTHYPTRLGVPSKEFSDGKKLGFTRVIESISSYSNK